MLIKAQANAEQYPFKFTPSKFSKGTAGVPIGFYNQQNSALSNKSKAADKEIEKKNFAIV